MPAIVVGTSPVERPMPGIVEEDDLPPGGQRVDNGRIPIVERPGEMLEKEQRVSRT